MIVDSFAFVPTNSRRRCVQFTTAMALWVAAAMAVAADQQERLGVARGRVVSSATYRYLAITPANFSDKSVRWPVIVFLHGGDQAGNDVAQVKVNGPPKYALENPEFPFVVIAPLLPADTVWEPAGVMAVVKQAIARFRGDPSRIYLTGISTGGYGVWKTALRYPERFAAVVPVAGGGSTETLKHATGEHLQALRALPVWAFHGGADSAVSAEETERMVAEFRAIGNPHAQSTIYAGAPHDIWSRVYDSPALYDWLLQMQR